MPGRAGAFLVFYGQGEGDGDALSTCSPGLAFGFFCRSCPNPIFWCPAPLLGGKVELAAKPLSAVKDKGRQHLLRVPPEQLARGHLGSLRYSPVAKAAWPSQPVALEATNPALGSTEWSVPIILCAPLHHHPQAEGLLSSNLAFHHAVEKHVPDTVLDGPPSPSNVSTHILRASEGISFSPGSGS